MHKNFPDTKSGNFPKCPQTFNSVRKLSKVFINFQSFWKLSRVFKNFAECPQTFQSIWKLSRGSETFHSAQKLSRVSNFFFKCLEIFQGVQKLSRVSRNFQKVAILVTFFYNHMQKLSGLQKLFIKQCLNAWEVFLTLSTKVTIVTVVTVLIRDCPDFWWTFKTFYSKLINYFLINQSLMRKCPHDHHNLCYHVLKGNYPKK